MFGRKTMLRAEGRGANRETYVTLASVQSPTPVERTLASVTYYGQVVGDLSTGKSCIGCLPNTLYYTELNSA